MAYFKKVERRHRGDVDVRYYGGKSYTLTEAEISTMEVDHSAQAMRSILVGHSNFSKSGIEDLTCAIDLAQEVMPTDQSPNYRPRLKDLIFMLIKKYEHTKALEDLEEAICRVIEMVSSTPVDHPDRTVIVKDWVNLLFVRFDHTGLQSDMDEAITTAQEEGFKVVQEGSNRGNLESLSILIPATPKKAKRAPIRNSYRQLPQPESSSSPQMRTPNLNLPVDAELDDKLQENNLCSFCRNVIQVWRTELIQNPPEGSYVHPETTNFYTWMACAKNGCPLSSRIFYDMPKGWLDPLLQDLLPGHEMQLQLSITKESRSDTWRVSHWLARNDMMPGAVLAPSATIVQPRLGPSTDSDLSLSQAKQWLDKCMKQHSQCSNSDHPPEPIQGPTRLIGVGEKGIQLCDPQRLPQFPHYATLSHCWGDLDIFRLKKENCESLFKSIPSDKLCKTFNDAIKVTRALGLNYLWIDSLCIVQDDKDDWRKESALMCGIYANGVVNIAATAAKDGSVGLFAKRDSTRVSRHYVSGSDGSVFEMMDSNLYSRCLNEAPLAKRGWVFQERYLAPRILHFTAEQIIWECQKQCACELWPDQIPTSYRRSSSFPKRNATEFSDIIEQYSRKDLTYPSDKLIALSGVAQHFQNKRKDKYLAGLWAAGIEKQLCWAVSQPMHIKLTPEEYQGPSWSWASINHPITWRLYSTNNVTSTSNYSPLCTLLGAKMIPVKDNLDELKGATLRLQCGPLIEVSAIQRLIANAEVSASYKGGQYVITRQKPTGEKDPSILQGSGKAYYDWNIDYKSLEKSVYCLPMFEAKALYGLMVVPAENKTKGHFSRVGVFDFAFNIKSYEELVSRIGTNSDAFMEEDMYEKVLEDKRDEMQHYEITLV